MATFTNAQMLSLMETISGSGLTAMELSKKTCQAQKMLFSSSPDFDKIVALFNNSSTDTRNGLDSGMSGNERTQSASTVQAEMSWIPRLVVLPHTKRCPSAPSQSAKLVERKAHKEDSNSNDNSKPKSDESEPDAHGFPCEMKTKNAI